MFGDIQRLEARVEWLRNANAGIRHEHRTQPLQPVAGAPTTLTVTTRIDERVQQLTCVLLAPDETELDFTRVTTHWDLLNWDYVGEWELQLPAFAEGAVVRYRIRARLASGESVWADDGELFAFQVGRYAAPAWVAGAMVYQIFPDRFSPGAGQEWLPACSLDDVHGGTLRGIIEHLDHVADLGFNAIWLNPFFPDSSSHGYQATDYFAVNPRLGTLDDVRELVARAHEKGMRLILDFVANHWGAEHPYFREAQRDRNSAYYDWFHWHDWPHGYLSYFNVREMPKLNVAHPAMRDHLFESIAFWLTDVGFDGLRLDHANGPAMHFWTELRAFLQQAKPDAWVFGEVSAPPDEVRRYYGRLHGALDFALVQALRDTFAHQSMSVARFDRLVEALNEFFPADFNRPLFLDNHDMDRFGWAVGGDTRKLKAAALYLFTQPQVPILYYGTEVGVQQRMSKDQHGSVGLAESRQPMLWGDAQDADLLAFFRWLVGFRRAHPAIWRGRRETLHCDGGRGTYAYVIADERERVLIAFNLSDRGQRIAVRHNDLAIDEEIDLPAWGHAVREYPAAG